MWKKWNQFAATNRTQDRKHTRGFCVWIGSRSNWDFTLKAGLEKSSVFWPASSHSGSDLNVDLQVNRSSKPFLKHSLCFYPAHYLHIVQYFTFWSWSFMFIHVFSGLDIFFSFSLIWDFISMSSSFHNSYFFEFIWRTSSFYPFLSNPFSHHILQYFVPPCTQFMVSLAYLFECTAIFCMSTINSLV